MFSRPQGGIVMFGSSLMDVVEELENNNNEKMIMMMMMMIVERGV